MSIFLTRVVFFTAERASLDIVIDSHGKILSDFMESNEFFVCNSRAVGDNPAKFTFNGPMGKSVIDLVWCLFSGFTYFKNFRVLDLSTHSDHFPVVVDLRDVNMILQDDLEQSIDGRLIFNQSLSQEFTTLLRWRDEVALVGDNVDQINFYIVSAVKGVASELKMEKSVIKSTKIGIKNKTWFDRECLELKRQVVHGYHDYKLNNFNSDS